MRLMVDARPRFPVPAEQFAALMQGFTEWRERYRSRMESFYFYAGGGGGGGVLVVEDEAALNEMMLEWPLLQFSEVTFTPILDGDLALKQWTAAAARAPR